MIIIDRIKKIEEENNEIRNSFENNTTTELQKPLNIDNDKNVKKDTTPILTGRIHRNAIHPLTPVNINNQQKITTAVNHDNSTVDGDDTIEINEDKSLFKKKFIDFLFRHMACHNI